MSRPAPRIFATIDPTSPRAEWWRSVLGTDRVEIESPWPHQGLYPDGHLGAFLKLKVASLTPVQFVRLAVELAHRFGEPIPEVKAGMLAEHGVPIEARDVTVTIISEVVSG